MKTVSRGIAGRLSNPSNKSGLLLLIVCALGATTDLLADDETTSDPNYFQVVDHITDLYFGPVILPTSKAEAGSDILNGWLGDTGSIDRDALYGRSLGSAESNATDSLSRNGYFSGQSLPEQDLAAAQQRTLPSLSTFDSLGQSVSTTVQKTGPTAPDSTMSRNGYFGGRTFEKNDFAAEQTE